MRRDLKRLAEEEYDLLIVGGGVNGLAAAWDASLRGLKVAVVEKGDFGAQTSSATLKIVHGGLRYLQHLDLVRSRESIRERSVMLAIAPHLVEPFPFVVPTYGHLLKGREFLSIGILLNEMVSFDRNRAIADPARRIPPGRVISRKECLDLVPCINRDGLNGGVIFYDAQMYNSERLTLSFALSAAEQGADAANYVEALSLLRRGDDIFGARVRDVLTGDEFDIRAAVTANMTGPWSDFLLELLDRPDPSREVVRSKGIQIVLPALTKDVAFAVQSRYEDPDAVIKHGGRMFFVTPWRGVSLAGTTDTVYRGDPDDFRITDTDIREFVSELDDAMPSVNLRREDATFAFGGMRPITEKNIDAGSKVARKYEVYDHSKDLGVQGLLSVIGVKYTTCRFLAEKVVNLAFEKLDRLSPAVATTRTPLVGGNIERFDDFLRESIEHPPAGLEGDVMEHLVRNYGSSLHVITDRVRADPRMGERLSGTEPVLRAEVVHAVREECAFHLPDVIVRRTDLGTKGHPGREALAAAGGIMAAELDWDERRLEEELEDAERCFDFSG